MNTTTGTFTGLGGLGLFYRRWLPAGEPAATVVILHEQAGHGGRFTHVAEALTGRGLAVYALDQRGHGQSEGERGWVERYDQFINDAAAFLDYLEVEGKLFVYGHSMGSNVTLGLVEKFPDKVDGVVLTGTTAQVSLAFPGWALALLKLIGRLLPRLRPAGINPDDLTHDEAVKQAYREDPLVNHEKIYARYLAEAIRAAEHLDTHPDRITTPFLMMHGTADTLAKVEGARWLHQQAGAEDKSIHIFEGMLHELHNEPAVREEMLGMMGDWLEARL